MALGGAGGKSGDIRAGGAFVELFSKDGGLRSGLAKAKAMVQNFGASMMKIGAAGIAAGAAILGPLAAAVNKAVDYTSAIQDAADRTGIAAEELQGLKHAAEQSGASFEDLERAISFMQKSGTGQSVEDFLKLVDQIADSMNPAATAAENFGKSGKQLLGLFRGGSEAVRKLMDEAKKLGIILSKEDVAAGEAFGDELAIVEKVAKSVVLQIGSALIPTLRDLVQPLIENMTAVLAWVKANRAMVVAIAGVGVALVAGGAAFITFGTAMIGVAATISVMSAGIGIVGSVLGAILTPIGLVATAIAGLTTAFAVSWARSAEGAAVLRHLGGVFDAFAQRTRDNFASIQDAMFAGNWGLAARIGLLAVQVEFGKFREAAFGEWKSFVSSLSTHWDTFTDSFSKGFSKGWDETLFMMLWKWKSWISQLLGNEHEHDFNRRAVQAWKAEFGDRPMPFFDQSKTPPPAVTDPAAPKPDRDGWVKKDIAAWWQPPKWVMEKTLAPGESSHTPEEWERGRKQAELEERLADLRTQAASEALKKMVGDAGNAAGGALGGAGPAKELAKVIQEIPSAVQGAFQSPNWQQQFAATDSLAKKQLDATNDGVEVQKKMLKRMNDMEAEFK